MKWLRPPVGGQKWKVDLVKGNHKVFGGDRCHGVTLNDKCRILIAKEYEKSVRQSTTIHELFGHAAFQVAGVSMKILDLCGGDEAKAHAFEEDAIRALELVWNPLFEHFGFRFPEPGA